MTPVKRRIAYGCITVLTAYGSVILALYLYHIGYGVGVLLSVLCLFSLLNTILLYLTLPPKDCFMTQVYPLGTRLHHIREAQEMTLADVSEKTGLSISFLSDMEHGRGNPSLDSLAKLSDCYEVTFTIDGADRIVAPRARPNISTTT